MRQLVPCTFAGSNSLVTDSANNEYDEEAEQAAKYILAIQKEDYTTNIELSLSCQNLPKLDFFSHSDPMVVVYLLEE